MGRRGSDPSGPDGLVVVDKPAGWTSHDVVAKTRGLLGTRKVGHAGTLDPDATGVLLIGVGRATRLLRYLSPLGKSYVGQVALGVETSTLDAAGEVTAVHDMSAVTLHDVARVAAGFVGDIEQVPPMVSAVKVGGRRLHELARQGVEVERDPRPVTIHSIDISPAPDPPPSRDPATATPDELGGESVAMTSDSPPTTQGSVFTMAVTCSSGTYIRSLAADIGSALGGGAHLQTLRRTSVGPFTLADAVALEAVGPDRVRPMVDAVRHLKAVSVGAAVAGDIGVGKVLDRAVLGLEPETVGPWAVLGPDADLLAVYEAFGPGTVKPALVIPR